MKKINSNFMMSEVNGRIFNFLLLLMICGVAKTSYCASYSADLSEFYLKPYVGMDAQFRHMFFRRNYGSHDFTSRYPQGNFYVGLKICDYLGFETGYFVTKGSRNSAFALGEMSLGVGTTMSMKANSNARIEGWHINAMGYFPLLDNDCLFAIGYIGISNTNIKLEQRYVEGELGPMRERVIKMNQTKTILRAGLGLIHMLTDHVGTRATLGWENTHRFKSLRKSRNSRAMAKLDDSVLLGIGIFARF